MKRISNRAGKYHVPSLERALSILEHLARVPEGATLADVTHALRVPKNSVYRILNTLHAHEYVLRDERDQRFRLSGKFLGLAYRGTASEHLVETAGSVLRQLRDDIGETALIGCLVDDWGVVLDQVPSRQPIKVQVAPGTRFPLHTAAPAKAILAWIPEEECRPVLAGISWRKFTAHTITCRRKFEEELARVRGQGFATDRGEELEGIHCVAAPVFDHHGMPVAAVWVTGPEMRLKSELFGNVGRLVARYAGTISKRMGAVPANVSSRSPVPR